MRFCLLTYRCIYDLKDDAVAHLPTFKNFILFALLIANAFVASAQNCKEPFLGSKTLYTSQQKKYSPLPGGYTPVFINHVGRHGARHLTKDAATTYIYQLLLHADSVNGLTGTGKLLKEKVLRLQKVEKNNFKSISNAGKEEQQFIAERMYAANQPVFDQATPMLNVSVTKEIRTTQTSDAFLSGLKEKINKPQITRQLNDTTLRFYDLSPAYLEYEEKGDWIQLWEKVKKIYKYDQLAKNVAARFFTPTFIKTLSETNKDEFTSDLYGFVTIFYSIQKEVEENGYKKSDVDMTSFLTCGELGILEKIHDAEDFLVKGPATNVNGIQVKIAVPLLADFIYTTDEYIKTKTINAQLRFTHAEAISPYAALMGITAASKPSGKVEDINKTWSAARIICLSANIQWILYKKKDSEDYLVKFLLNEKEVSINGLTTKTFPYYNWKDARAFYINKIKSFNSRLDENGFKYLQRVR